LKTARLYFLVLLAVLLPIRGAVAAAMLCPIGGSGVQSELRWQAPAAAHEAVDHAMAHDHGSSHGHASNGHDHHDDHGTQQQSAQDKCNMCSAYCSLTPLVSSAPTLPGPLDRAAIKFSDFSAPPPNFFSDGQERPPRTT
jgi:hypothetical protein